MIMLRNDSGEGSALHSSSREWSDEEGLGGLCNRQTIDVNNIMDIELEPRQ